MHSQFLSASYIILTPVSYHIYDFLNFNSSSCILNFFIRNYISWQVHFSFLLFLTVPYSISSLEKMMRNEYRTCVSIIFRKAFKQFIHFTCSQKTARQSTALMFFFLSREIGDKGMDRKPVYLLYTTGLCTLCRRVTLFHVGCHIAFNNLYGTRKNGKKRYMTLF